MSANLTRGKIQSVSELVEWVSSNGSFRIFRGQRVAKWPLVPSVQRNNVIPANSPGQRLAFEMEMLHAFQRKARPHLAVPPADSNRWDWLAIAQHYGVPTRLLDWSESLAFALYFAVEGETDNNGAALWMSEHPPLALTRHVDPFLIDHICLFEPPHVSPRITVQQSCFTVHPTDYVGQEYEWPCKLAKVFVPAEARSPILKELRMLGVNRASLFPDLEGIASDIRASYSNDGYSGVPIKGKEA